MENKESQEAFRKVISNLVNRSLEQIKKDPQFEKLFDSDSMDGILREAFYAHNRVTLATTQAVEAKLGHKVNPAQYEMLKALEALVGLMRHDKHGPYPATTDTIFYLLCGLIRDLK